MNIEEEFDSSDYPVGTMFMYWFENLMVISNWFKLNWETQELSRKYWDRWHERRR